MNFTREEATDFLKEILDRDFLYFSLYSVPSPKDNYLIAALYKRKITTDCFKLEENEDCVRIINKRSFVLTSSVKATLSLTGPRNLLGCSRTKGGKDFYLAPLPQLSPKGGTDTAKPEKLKMPIGTFCFSIDLDKHNRPYYQS